MTQLVVHCDLTSKQIDAMRIGEYTTVRYDDGRVLVLRVMAIRNNKPEWRPARFWERIYAAYLTLRGRTRR